MSLMVWKVNGHCGVHPARMAGKAATKTMHAAHSIRCLCFCIFIIRAAYYNAVFIAIALYDFQVLFIGGVVAPQESQRHTCGFSSLPGAVSSFMHAGQTGRKGLKPG
jgi:hypothetical protein